MTRRKLIWITLTIMACTVVVMAVLTRHTSPLDKQIRFLAGLEPAGTRTDFIKWSSTTPFAPRLAKIRMQSYRIDKPFDEVEALAKAELGPRATFFNTQRPANKPAFTVCLIQAPGSKDVLSVEIVESLDHKTTSVDLVENSEPTFTDKAILWLSRIFKKP